MLNSGSLERKKKDSNHLCFWMSAFLVLVSGYTIMTKYQVSTNGKDSKPFKHPYWQTFVTCIGETFALAIFVG